MKSFYRPKLILCRYSFSIKYLIIALFLTQCSTFAQSPIIKLTPDDYKLWAPIYIESASPEGNWISYRVESNTGSNSVQLTNRKSGVSYSVPEGYGKFTFNGEDHFSCLVPSSNLQVINLKTGIRTLIANVQKSFFSANKKYLVTLEKENDNVLLVVRDNNLKTIWQKEQVDLVEQSPDQNSFVYAGVSGGKSELFLASLEKKFITKSIAKDIDAKFTTIVWNTNSSCLSAVANASNGNGVVIFYNTITNKVSSLKESHNQFPKDRDLAGEYESMLRISPSGKTVFFGTKSRKPSIYHPDSVEVWNGNDKWIYPRLKSTGDWNSQALIASWHPEEGIVAQLATAERPYIMLNGNEEIAITFDPEGVTKNQFYEKVDLYLTDLHNDEVELWLEAQSVAVTDINFSPDGKFVAVNRDNKWLLYEFKTKIWSDLQKQIKIDSNIPYNNFLQTGVAGWQKDFIFLYDGFDIWRVPLRKGAPQKLTNGRSIETVYKFFREETQRFGTSVYNGYIGTKLSETKPLIIEINAPKGSGFCTWSSDKGLQPILFEPALIKNLVTVGHDKYYYQSESTNEPPSIRALDKKKNTVEIVFQSNSHFVNYPKVKVEVITYDAPDFKDQKGILYYPDDYIAGKKYPIIVHIYEQQIYLLNRYLYPYLETQNGFNIRHLLAQGYFVYLPEINYKLGETGISAAKSVIAATQQVIKLGLAHHGMIGLIGHSFGGYETNFIITQTDVFSAAVSGAGAADTTDHFFSMDWNNGHANGWRYTHQQWRMGKSPFDDKEGYDRNSARVAAPAISTPILLWSGEKDLQVNTKETISFYLALRELDKQCIFLKYPNEDHVLVREENQRNLTQKIDQWFAYFLKGDTSPQWITNGIK